MTSILLALRLGRWGILGFAALGFVSTFAQALAFYALAGHSAAEQAAFGNAISTLAAQFSAILPPPIRPDTVGGYVEWRGFHAIGLLFAVWAVASATGMSRVDEEHGVIEAALATGTSRIELLGTRVAAFGAGAVVASLAAAAGFIAAVSTHNDTPNWTGLVEESVLLASLAICCYAIALLTAQVSSPRSATSAAGAVVLVLFLVDSLSRTFDWLLGPRWISPFRYYDLNQPLPPGGTFQPVSVAILLGIAVIAVTAAGAAFAFRDLGSALVRLPGPPHVSRSDAAFGPWWRVPVVRDIYDRRVGLLAWTVGAAALGVVFTWLTKTIIQPLLNIPQLLPYFALVVHGNIYPSFLGFIWFSFAQLVFAAFAITQVSRWATEDGDGRLAAILSQPRSRASVVLERIAALTLGAAVMAVVSGLAVLYASSSQGIDLDHQRLIAASLLLVPFALVFSAAGAVLTSWRPRAAVFILGAVAFASYLDSEVGKILGWPVWVQDLSAFRLFGTPLSTGIDQRDLAIMVLLVLAGLGSSILLMQRRDVGA
ncbi:MAG TPA: hypothetical protein VHO95_09285 [Candidatus Dormibacteraeota bacterium]|nr:hypothetical protein [Candidatus Dormibacteraeota bacterium]HEX2680568.1 hypothetical protein [Candidatus Dormibacteraeota bacterium]